MYLFADNVHFASSAQLAKALTEEDIQFRFQVQQGHCRSDYLPP